MKATNEYVPKLDLRLTQESEETLYELAPCGYCSCLPDGTLVKLNQTLLGWVGYAREEVVAGHCLQHLLTIGGALHFETYGIPLLLLQGHVRELSYELRHKDGSTQPVLLNATLVYDTHGSPLVARVTLFDITDRRRYEQELLRAKKLADSQREQLAQANAALLEKNKLLTRINADLDTFIYTASHDLRSPITNIEGLLNLLRRHLPTNALQTQAVAHVLALVKASVERFKATIHQLTDITRLQQSQVPPPETVDIAALVNDIRLDLAPQLAAADAQLIVEVGQCPHVCFARGHLRSIIYNLLSNGVKYCHPDRRPIVRVRCYQADATTILEVQDNGLGLSSTEQAHLFSRFQRLHNHVEGIGIGLYTIRRIVENAGGTITVQSEPGVGSTFIVALPT
jgi:sigma-B regulation protein RsbU (phosphoserine phosphatase)